MLVSLSRLGAPGAYPLTLAEVKAHLRVDGDDEAATITAHLEAAIETVEGDTGRCLVSQEWEARFSGFPPDNGPLTLPGAPLLSVSSVAGRGDEGWVSMTDGTYATIAPRGPRAQRGSVHPLPGYSWPAVLDGFPGGARVIYTAGYAAPPQALLQAVLLVVGDLYANREAASVAKIQEQPAYRNLIAPYRTFWVD